MRRLTTGILVTFFLFAFTAQADVYSISAADKDFFGKIRTAILGDDAEWLSKAISYPIVIKGNLKLKNTNDLKQHADLVFSRRIKSAVRKQSPDALFKNWQGIMIGDGEIWFAKVAENTEKGEQWVYRIIAINLDGNLK